MRTKNSNFGLNSPSIDFEQVRDNRRSLPLYIDVDLTTARTVAAGTALSLNIAGNSFYIDADTSTSGYGTVYFQDTNLGLAAAPIYVNAGFIAKVPFTQILIVNPAQSGKRLRIFYGVDLDFQAGVNASINISGTVSNGSQVRKTFTQAAGTVGVASAQLLAANTGRDYLLIQNNHASGNIYVTVDGTAATTANGVKIAAGGSYELSNTVPTGIINAIGDVAAMPVVVVSA